jgi:hypothetical protein
MKKLLVLTLIDGRVIERDITTAQGFPIGAKANDEAYARFCQAISQGGYTDLDKTISETEYHHIAPSQIKSVSVIFNNTLKVS